MGRCWTHIPPRDGDGEAVQSCSWPHPTSRNSLGDPGAGKEPPNKATESTEGCRSNEPHAEGTFLPLCPQWGAGVLPSPAALWAAGATTTALPLHSSDLWMFAHSCLLMCLITKKALGWSTCRSALPIPLLGIGTVPMPDGSTHFPEE